MSFFFEEIPVGYSSSQGSRSKTPSFERPSDFEI